VKHLSRLTPAETLILKNGDKAPLSDLLKYTLMDLLLKQVLVIEEVQRQSNSRDPIRIYKYIAAGTNFVKYQFRSHEIVFLSMFQENAEIRLLFRNLVKVAYQNAKSQRQYYPLLINNVNLKAAFVKTIFHRIFGGFDYTEKGLLLKGELQNEISELEKTLPGFIKNDRNRGLEMLKTIGGNIFLLKGVDFAISKEIDEELFEEMSTKRRGSGCSSGCWSNFDDYSDTFDSSCSSDTGSGCGGDGGCSGCSSGCSGCGGCGGD